VNFRAILLIVMFATLVCSSGCDDNTPLCVPGSKLPHLCSDGTLGSETCSKDGLSYGARCAKDEGGAGPGGTGGVAGSD
jgi:hypothetical protein